MANPPRTAVRKVTRTHRWFDADGALAFEHRKWEDGSWSYRHPVSRGGCSEHPPEKRNGKMHNPVRGEWCAKKPMAAVGLMWRHAELLDAVSGGYDVGWFAGEKDAESGRRAGLAWVCTSVHQGESAGTYPEQAEIFRDFPGDVVLYLDDDKAGWKNGLDRHGALLAVGVLPGRIVLRLPAEGSNDVSDHLGDAQARARGWRSVAVDNLRSLVGLPGADTGGGASGGADGLEAVYGALEALGCRRGTGQDWTCPHPDHADEHPSCGVMLGKNGDVVFNCQTCMPKPGTSAHKRWYQEIIAALGLKRASASRYPMNDIGNAQRLLAKHNDDMFWIQANSTTGDWRIWNGTRWDVDVDKTVEDWAHAVSAEITAEANAMPESADPKKRNVEKDKLRAFGLASGNDGKVNAMLNRAKGIPGRTVTAEKFDANTRLLAVGNGVLELGSDGVVFRAEAREDYLTKRTAVNYVPGATDVMWNTYLDMFLPKADLREFVQRLVGYGMLGGNPAGLMLFLQGGSNTGKSTLNNMIMDTFGDYAYPMEMSALRGTWGTAPREDVASIMKARYAVASETSNSGIELHADQIKRFTGDDAIAYSVKFGHQQQSRPWFLALIATNSPPSVKGTDKALLNRLCVVPFTNEEVDKTDSGTAMRESASARAAFLAWAVEGYASYCRVGLARDTWPLDVLLAVSEYKTALSDVSAFIADCCEEGPEYSVYVPDLAAAWRAWCDVNDIKDIGATAFGREMNGLGHVRGKDVWDKDLGVKRGVRLGLRLRSAKAVR